MAAALENIDDGGCVSSDGSSIRHGWHHRWVMAMAMAAAMGGGTPPPFYNCTAPCVRDG